MHALYSPKILGAGAVKGLIGYWAATDNGAGFISGVQVIHSTGIQLLYKIIVVERHPVFFAANHFLP